MGLSGCASFGLEAGPWSCPGQDLPSHEDDWVSFCILRLTPSHFLVPLPLLLLPLPSEGRHLAARALPGNPTLALLAESACMQPLFGGSEKCGPDQGLPAGADTKAAELDRDRASS